MNVDAPGPPPGSDEPASSSATEPTPAKSGSATPTTGKKTVPKHQQITVIDDVLHAAFKSRARVLELSGEVLRKLQVEDSAIDQQSTLTRELAADDPTLAGPFRILQLVASKGVNLNRAEAGLGPVLNRLVDLALVAMTNHPVFRVWSDQLLDPKAEPPLTSRLVRQFAREANGAKLGLPEDAFSPRDRVHLQSNAIACFALLRVLRGPWSLDDFVDEMREHDWVHEAPLTGNTPKAAAAIASDRRKDVLEAVSARYLRRIGSLERRLEALTRAAETSANREARLEGELRESRAREQKQELRVREFSEQIARLQKDLADERENRAVDQSHMSDDFETLRTRIIRIVGGEITLLTDGLHALRNGAPEVADEFVDRSLTALSREVQELRAGGGLE